MKKWRVLFSVNSGVNEVIGFTRLVVPIPNKKDSMSALLLDNLERGIAPCNTPSPANLVSHASPLEELV